MGWREPLDHDPVPDLMASRDPALNFFVRRDLLGENGMDKRILWQDPKVLSLFRAQRPEGHWFYKAKKATVNLGEDYEYLETYRNLGILSGCYGLDREHPGFESAVEYLLGKQTDEGDLRGIYSNQYSPNYTAACLEIMSRTGFAEDPRVLKGYDWLMSMRMDDGGWAIPMRTAGVMTLSEAWAIGTVQPVKGKPSSHWVTGVVLRALAAHPRYRRSVEAVEASMLLKSRLLKADKYTDRRAPSFWLGFSYPFWWTDLISALDSLSRVGMPFDDPDIAKAMVFIKALQNEDGSFKFRVVHSGLPERQRWIALALCRALRRFHGHQIPEG